MFFSRKFKNVFTKYKEIYNSIRNYYFLVNNIKLYFSLLEYEIKKYYIKEYISKYPCH